MTVSDYDFSSDVLNLYLFDGLIFNLIVHKPSFSLIFAFFSSTKKAKIIRFNEYAITIVSITHLVWSQLLQSFSILVPNSL